MAWKEERKKKIDNLGEMLQKGVNEVFTSTKYKEWLKAVSCFHSYSFNNTILISCQMPTATKVAGFSTWKKLGRRIKKGEKAIKIFSPAPFVVKEDEDGEEKEVVKRMFYKPCSVFDISQTEGKDLPSQFCPQEIAGNVDYFSEILNAAEMVCPCRIVYEDLHGMNGYYHKDSDHISVRNDMSELMTIKTLIHEIAHQKLHSDGAEEECATREKKEVQAESIAFIVAERFGIDTSAYSFNYIAAWSKDRKQDELEESLKVIKKTADWFITEMENVLSDEVKNENQ